MSTKTNTSTVVATFEIKNWIEQAVDQMPDDVKITRAAVTKEYGNDISGTSLTEWTMSYRPDGSARFVGMERIEGTIRGHDGTLVLQHVGTYRDGVAKGTLEIVVGAGTGHLASATGFGSFVADPKGSLELELTFE